MQVPLKTKALKQHTLSVAFVVSHQDCINNLKNAG